MGRSSCRAAPQKGVHWLLVCAPTLKVCGSLRCCWKLWCWCVGSLPPSPLVGPSPAQPRPLPTPLHVVANQEGFVFRKEFLPVLQPLLGLEQGPPTTRGCLLTIASIFVDTVGWRYNPAYLPVVHDRLHQLASALEHAVGSR